MTARRTTRPPKRTRVAGDASRPEPAGSPSAAGGAASEPERSGSVARRVAHLLPWALALAAASIGMGGLLLGALPMEWLSEFPDALAPDAEAESFPPQRLTQLQARATLVGIGWLLLALLAIWPPVLPRETVAGLLAALPRRAREATRRILRFVREEPFDAFFLAAFVLTSLALGLRAIDQPIRCDEAGTFLNYVSKPWYQTISDYAANNHVFYSLLAKAACSVIEDQTVCVRTPSLVAGILLAPATYVTARVHFDRVVALLATALVSTSFYATDFATNGRGYTVLTLVFLGLLTIAPRLLERRDGLVWVAFVLLSAIGFWTVPVMAYPFAAG